MLNLVGIINEKENTKRMGFVVLKAKLVGKLLFSW